jgi:hypothetical protein
LRFIRIIAAAASATAITGAGIAAAQVVDPDPILVSTCELAARNEPNTNVVDAKVVGPLWWARRAATS